MRYWQQGDVLLCEVTVPKGGRKIREHRRGVVLAEGEASGHAHVATAENAVLFEIEGILYLSAPSGTEVVHEEHGTVIVPPGDYTVGIVREYDHFAEEARRVVD